jgi:hypothetical protein
MNAHRSQLASKKSDIGVLIPGIAADQAMLAKEPEIAKPGDRRSSDIIGEKLIRTFI